MDAARKIHPLTGDSAEYDYSLYHGLVDLFFIDNAHSYEYVRSDTLNAMKCCHPGSVIAWHDFGRVGVNGVSRWLLEFSKQHQVYSVRGGSIAFCVI
jgi:Methyltransferase domain